MCPFFEKNQPDTKLLNLTNISNISQTALTALQIVDIERSIVATSPAGRSFVRKFLRITTATLPLEILSGISLRRFTFAFFPRVESVVVLFGRGIAVHAGCGDGDGREFQLGFADIGSADVSSVAGYAGVENAVDVTVENMHVEKGWFLKSAWDFGAQTLKINVKKRQFMRFLGVWGHFRVKSVFFVDRNELSAISVIFLQNHHVAGWVEVVASGPWFFGFARVFCVVHCFDDQTLVVVS